MNQSRSILESRLQQLYYLQKSIDFYQILELQKIVYEFRIIIIQYITRFDTHSIELSHRHMNIKEKRIPCHQIINKLMELLQLIEIEFRSNEEYKVMCKKIPEYMEKLNYLSLLPIQTLCTKIPICYPINVQRCNIPIDTLYP